MRRALLVSWLVTAAAGAVGAMVACSVPDPTQITEVDAPDYNQFKGAGATATQAGVSRVLEMRCGSLDCHGQVGRPMRIYGQFGLRYVDPTSDVLLQPGLGATTELEYEANYQAVIGLQPEQMTLVVDDQAPPESLMLLRKPLQLERHKGGAVIVEGDPAYDCITTWLGGQVDLNACGGALGLQ